MTFSPTAGVLAIRTNCSSALSAMLAVALVLVAQAAGQLPDEANAAAPPPASAWPPSSAPDPQDNAPELQPEISRLGNGLQVVIVPDHALPLLNVATWYRVGTADDEPNHPGLCHVAGTLLAHRRDAALRLGAAGVRFESGTLRDACYFSSTMPATPDFLEYVLKIEAERMQPEPASADALAQALAAAADIPPAPPRTDAKGVLSHLSSVTAFRDAHELPHAALAAIFPDHPYRNPPGLVSESLARALTPAELTEFLRDWFVPGNATLFIIGDVQPPVALDAVRRQFAAVGWAEPSHRPDHPLPAPAGPSVSIETDQRRGVDLVWVTPPAGAAENTQIDVLMELLCNEVDGALYQRLRDVFAGVYWRTPAEPPPGAPLHGRIRAERDPQKPPEQLRPLLTPPLWRRLAWHDCGVLVLSLDWCRWRPEGRGGSCAGQWFGPEQGDRERMTALVRLANEEVRAAAERIPTEIQLNRARALAQLAARQRATRFPDRARALAEAEIIAGDVLLEESAPLRIRSIGVSDLQRAARMLNESEPLIIEYGLPAADPDGPRAGAGMGPLAGGAATASRPARPPPGPTSAPATIEPREPPLAPADLLARLAQFAETAPPITTSPRRPHVDVQRLGDDLIVTSCPVPGIEDAWLWCAAAQPRWRRGPLRRPSPDYGLNSDFAPGWWLGPAPAKSRDYLSYHGFALWDAESGDLWGNVPPARAAAALEWSARLESWRTAPRFGYQPHPPHRPIEVLAAGAVDSADLARWAREFWSPGRRPGPGQDTPDSHAMSPSTKPAAHSPGAAAADGQPQRAVEQDGQPARRPDIALRWERMVPPTSLVRVQYQFHVADAFRELSELDRDALAVLLGRLPLEGGPPCCDPRWKLTALYPPNELLGEISVPGAQLVATVGGIWAQVQALRDGTLPLAQVDLALRLARAHRLVALDGPEAILDALWAGRTDPWDLEPAETAENLRHHLKDVVARTDWVVTIYGDEIVRPYVRALEDATGEPLAAWLNAGRR